MDGKIKECTEANLSISVTVITATVSTTSFMWPLKQDYSSF